MAELTQGLLDASVVIDHDLLDPALLPDDSAIASVTLAELAAGAHVTADIEERARRQDRLQWAATTWDPLPFDGDAGTYGRVFAATLAAGRSHRARLADLLIASTAAANSLRLYTSERRGLRRTGRHRPGDRDLTRRAGAAGGCYAGIVSKAATVKCRSNVKAVLILGHASRRSSPRR